MAEHHRKRTRKFTAFLSEEERALLEAKADDADMSKTEYVRNLILFGATRVRPIISDEYGEKIRCGLTDVGNGLNQIAKKANATRIFDNCDMDLLYKNYIELLTVYDEFLRGKFSKLEK